METLLVITHVVVCLFLVVIVLLQQGKGADAGAAFGGGSSQSLFGTEGPLSLLNKVTTTAAVIFMLTSVMLAYNSSHKSHSSVMAGVEVESRSSAETEVEKKKDEEKPVRTVGITVHNLFFFLPAPVHFYCAVE